MVLKVMPEDLSVGDAPDHEGLWFASWSLLTPQRR